VRGPLYTVLLTIFFSFAIELRTVRHRQKIFVVVVVVVGVEARFFGTGPDIIISVFLFFKKEKKNKNSCLTVIALRRFHPTPNRTPPSILLLFTIAAEL
jgi:hypothetical protein